MAQRLSKARKYCGKWRWLNHETGELAIWHCNAWDCPTCSKLKASQLAKKIAKEARRNEFKALITLTLPSWYRNKAYKTCDKALKQGFKRLARKARREGQLMEYIWVEERHRDGTPHLHILGSLSWTKHRLHDEAHDVGLGYMADITPILDDGGYFYVAKYLGKGEKQIPKDIRRVGTSRGVKLQDVTSCEGYWSLYVSNPLD